MIYGIILIVGGIIYIIKPDIFKRGIWKKTAITQQIFTPKQYNIYMRILGTLSIIIGVYMIIRHNNISF